MYDYINIPEIVDDIKFENMTLDIYRKILKSVQKNGRNGQAQNGVDIFGYNENKELVGIQCKVKNKADFTNKQFRKRFLNEIIMEIEKAKKFDESLKLFIIATTAPRDSYIQKEIIKINQYPDINFQIQVSFWDDIVYMLCDEIHRKTFYKYYADLIIKERTIGSVKAKTLSLIVGVTRKEGKFFDSSTYKLILGYIPKIVEYPNGIEYYSNSYFIGCFQDCTLDTFKLTCYPSDLENVIKNTRDRYIISDWLNTIDIDMETESDIREYNFNWSHEQFRDYLESLNN